MQGIDDVVARAAHSRISGLILGEAGVGKEELARRIHQMSPRAGRPFLILDCAAPTATVRTELFGREGDPSTRAPNTRVGLLENVNGGDVFLAEVGELEPAVQAELMRLVETREVVRLGGHEARRFDVRFISSSSGDLELAAKADRFRLDLFSKLSGFILKIQPLRERTGEISTLVDTIIKQSCLESGRKPLPTFTPETMDHLMEYDWPGNIRELKVAIGHALRLSEGAELLPSPLGPGWSQLAPSLLEASEKEDYERSLMLAALTACQGGKTRAAEMLRGRERSGWFG